MTATQLEISANTEAPAQLVKSSSYGGKRPGTGGKRPGAGRKKLTPDVGVCIQELIFPAICSAFHASPDDGKYAAYLTIHLSKTDIRIAYGAEGLSTFCSFFKQEKRGGRNLSGEGYATRWVVPLGVYATVIELAKSFGHTIKDLPRAGFPPDALTHRVAEAKARRDADYDKKQKAARRARAAATFKEENALSSTAS